MPHSTFDNFGLPAKLAHALTRIQFITPTPIQVQAIPLALQGKDVLGSAQTGTGKTGAFGIPVIAGLMALPDAAALIMTPTRELASQVMAAIEPMIPTVDIRTALLIGGEAMPRQIRQLQHKPRLIVGTPGRINDHLDRGNLTLANVRFLVLDETDRMLDMGFGIQIERILKHVSSDRQTLLFSATLPSNIIKLSAKYMRDPVRIAVGSTTNPITKIKQEVISTTDHDKYSQLIDQLEARKGSIIIFVKTKYGTEKLADKLNKAGHRADAIHGDLQQRRRERVIQNFRDKKYRILVATDIAARGLDIPHIAHVVNYDMPQVPEDYIHRIGRTARAGAEGEAISFLTSADNMKWRAIQRLMNGEETSVVAPHRGHHSPSRKGAGGPKRSWQHAGERSRGEHAPTDRPRGDHSHHKKHPSQSSFKDRPYAERSLGGKPQPTRSSSSRDERSYRERSSVEQTNDNQSHSNPMRTDRSHAHRSPTDPTHPNASRGHRPFRGKSSMRKNSDRRPTHKS